MIDELDEINLRIPGPTALPVQVREALSRQMINHRGGEFKAILREVHAHLQYFFATEAPVLTFPAAGTGGLEAAVVNVFSPGDVVVAASIGVFGDRFTRIAHDFGLTVYPVTAEWGQALTPEAITAVLDAHPEARGLLVTHNETSTGVLNPIEAIARAVRALRPDLLVLVDAISGLGTAPLWADAWGLDVVITGSQKAWMVPPGMTMLSVSERAWAAHAVARLPRHYWDFAAARKEHDAGDTPYTPAVSLFYGLQVALRMMRAEGREAVWARHAALAERTRTGVRHLGLTLLADPDHLSQSVTAVCVPDGVDASALLREARESHRTVFGSGQKSLSGRIIRIGHLGWMSETHIDAALDALAASLAVQGWSLPRGRQPSGV